MRFRQQEKISSFTLSRDDIDPVHLRSDGQVQEELAQNGLPTNSAWVESQLFLPDEDAINKMVREFFGFFYLPIGIRLLSSALGVGPAIFWLLIVCWLAVLIYLLARKVKQLTPTMPASSLIEDPTDEKVCVVKLQILVDHQITGEDEGVAWFEQGCLMFTGRRCSFSVGGQDLVPLSEEGWGARRTNSLLLKHPEHRLEVTMHPQNENTRYRAVASFAKRRREFLTPPRMGTGARQYPPLSQYPFA